MKKTLMVGAGVVNLVSAYFLAKANHRLTIVDKGPNPLYPAFWKKLGCTFGGENVRMFTYTEADNYNEKGSQLYSRMDEAFERVIGDSGWLVRPKETLNAQEQAWIQDFHAVSPADAIQFGEEIYRVNISSGKIWQQWMEEAPELFDDVDLVQDILRIYSDPADFHAAQKLHGRLGSLTEVLSTESALEK
ncbi:MAG: hypothetical protein KDC65_04305, partial [Saprospiraceae bacterium]|nr:hypothetical protein [Saprospiraceae bacterium]